MLELISQTLLLPTWIVLLLAFVWGTIFGSFLDVCISRFHTGKSINGSSRCMSCGKRLRWYELIPVVSYVLQGGRCRACGARIPARLLIMELVTGGLVVLAVLVAASWAELLFTVVLLFVLLAITVYDYLHFIIPDAFTVLLTAVVGAWLGYQWWTGAVAPAELLIALGASLAGAGFLFLLWAISRGQWLGFGDVKLAIPLGLLVGPMGVFSFIVVSFWVGAGLSLAILGYQRYLRGKQFLHLSAETITMKSAVPFAPFLVMGALLVYVFHLNVLALFSFG